MDENVNPDPNETVEPAPLSDSEMGGPDPVEPAPPVAPPPPPAPEAPMAPPAPPQQEYAPPPPPQQSYAPPPPPQAGAPMAGAAQKDKLVAGILGILLGSLGIHKFYLGYTTEGIILVAVTVLTMGMLSWASAIVGIIEGVIYLTKTDEDFQATYVVGKKKWF